MKLALRLALFSGALVLCSARELPSFGSVLTDAKNTFSKLPGLSSLQDDTQTRQPGQYQGPQGYQSPSYQRYPGQQGPMTGQTRAFTEAERALQQAQDFQEYLDPKVYAPDAGLVAKDPNRIRFLLYTDPNNPERFDEIIYGDENSLRQSSFDPQAPTKILIHGFQSSYSSSFPQNVKNSYLATRGQTGYNIIVVDWGALAIPNAPYIAPIFYPLVVNNVWTTGQRVGEFIVWLNKLNAVDLNRVHIIGFSLGSHIAGKAGDFVKQSLGQPVARITGLDPAGPEFYTGTLARRLSPNDAQFVDAIHTNAGILGSWENYGQVDFFVNGGAGPQPGCVDVDTIDAAVKSVTGTVSGLCSHIMATKYFTRTILNGLQRRSDRLCTCSSLPRFTVSPKSCCEGEMIVFGEYTPPGTRGTYYVSYGLNGGR